MWGFCKSKYKPRKKSKEVQKALDKSKDLKDTEVKLIDEKNREYSLKIQNKRRAVDMEVYRVVKRALKLKSEGMFYKNERQIARKFHISETTVALIRRASSFKNYQTLRWVTSRGHGTGKRV